MDKHTIINLKLKNISNRQVARTLGVNRKTVARYWNEYKSDLRKLNTTTDINEITEIQEKITEAPKHDTSARKCRKYTKEMDQLLDEILDNEVEKCKLLNTDKQRLTQVQIHQLILEAGHEISLSTITNKIREKRQTTKECYIKQTYDFGDRLEYDFGEVKLIIDGVVDTYHLAVLSSPASNFRWAYLYTNQKKEVFLDSQVKFFEMVKGVPKEVVYDNMRNVVTKFIGRHKKKLNEDLIKLSMYYGFDINVTNCFSGNEKGHVEGSVKVIRNRAFALHYKFKTLEEAKTHLYNSLVELNKKSSIEEEIKYLNPTKPPLDLANIREQKVNKYSFVQVESNHYSVPEYLVDRIVSLKIYYDKIKVYSNNKYVCDHKKIDGTNEISIDISHYLNSFVKKPGALKNSLALKSSPQLKAIYDKYFTKKTKEFIELIRKNHNKTVEELIKVMISHCHDEKVVDIETIKAESELKDITRKQTSRYNEICLKRG